MKVDIADKRYTIGLFDTAGQAELLDHRKNVYPRTDVLLICFSVVGPTSYENIKSQWMPEIKEYCAKAPFILVGTQIDLRKDDTTLAKLGRATFCNSSTL